MIFFKVEITIDMEVLPLAMRPKCAKSYMNNFPMSFVHISLKSSLFSILTVEQKFFLGRTCKYRLHIIYLGQKVGSIIRMRDKIIF